MRFARCWFQIVFYFHPVYGKDFQFDSYFSDGLVQPPTSLWFVDPNLKGASCAAKRNYSFCSLVTLRVVLVVFSMHFGRLLKHTQPQAFLGGGFKYFLFSSLFGEMIQFD